MTRLRVATAPRDHAKGAKRAERFQGTFCVGLETNYPWEVLAMTSLTAMGTGLGGTSRDLALVSRAVSGERTAFEALVERYGGRVFRICRAMTKDRDAA